jgi:hypothetical protein
LAPIVRVVVVVVQLLLAAALQALWVAAVVAQVPQAFLWQAVMEVSI